MHRIQAENQADMALIRWLCIASIARTALTQVLPLAGSAAWWLLPVLALPGIAVALLLRLMMTITCADTITEALRAALGPFGAWSISLIFAALLLVEGTTGMTALITLFTQGIGTRGTQFTLALLTLGVMAFCLHPRGLPRAAVLLRWPVLAAAVTVAAFALPQARLDHLYPLAGTQSLKAAVRAGFHLAWPVSLLLTVPPADLRQSAPRCRRFPAALAVLIPGLAAPMLCVLILPDEVLTAFTQPSALLLLPGRFALPAVRTLWQCLLMLMMFLAVAAGAQLAAEHLCAPASRSAVWLPLAFAAAFALLQACDSSTVWRICNALQRWSLAPLGLIALLGLAIAPFRRQP